MSNHSSVTAATYRASVAASGSGVPKSMGKAKQAPVATAMARFGFTKARFQAVGEHDTTSGGFYGPKEIAALMEYLGELLGFAVHGERLILDLLVLILNHKATDDVKDLGGFDIYANDESSHEFCTWESFKQKCIPFFRDRGQKFTFRKFIPGLNSVFRELWLDVDVRALDLIRNEGTQASREFRMPDGSPVAAYVLVPGLFDNYLSNEEWEMRRIARAAVNLDKGGTEVQVYSGVNKADEVDDAVESEKRSKELARRRKLWMGASGPGKKDPGKKEVDEWIKGLN
jgi:hypothetical protein